MDSSTNHLWYGQTNVVFDSKDYNRKHIYNLYTSGWVHPFCEACCSSYTWGTDCLDCRQFPVPRKQPEIVYLLTLFTFLGKVTILTTYKTTLASVSFPQVFAGLQNAPHKLFIWYSAFCYIVRRPVVKKLSGKYFGLFPIVEVTVTLFTSKYHFISNIQNSKKELLRTFCWFLTHCWQLLVQLWSCLLRVVNSKDFFELWKSEVG